MIMSHQLVMVLIIYLIRITYAIYFSWEKFQKQIEKAVLCVQTNSMKLYSPWIYFEVEIFFYVVILLLWVVLLVITFVLFLKGLLWINIASFRLIHTHAGRAGGREKRERESEIDREILRHTEFLNKQVINSPIIGKQLNPYLRSSIIIASLFSPSLLCCFILTFWIW